MRQPLISTWRKQEGPDGKFAQKISAPTKEDTVEEEPKELEETEDQDPSTPNTSIRTLDDSFDFAPPIHIGRGRPKQPKIKNTNTIMYKSKINPY